MVAVCLLLTGCRADTKSAADAQPVSWAVARQLMQHCQVKHLEETHSRLVNLTLRNGRKVFAHEPKSDNIFRILNRLPRTCWPKTVAEE
jgi:hypothetical protein